MKNITRALFIYFTCGFFSMTIGNAAGLLGGPTTQEIQEEFEKWQHRDGDVGFEVSPVLAKMFVANSKAFFQVASEHKKEYDAWVEDLEECTFRIFDVGSIESLWLVESELVTSYNETLRNLMLKECRKFESDSNYKALAKKLKNKLKVIKITTVD
jgi:hypothetical protein